MAQDKLDLGIVKLKQQFARLFTAALQRQAEKSTKRVVVLVDPKNKLGAYGFITTTAVKFGIFQDLGTGNRSGNPQKDKMYREAVKGVSRLFGPPARKFSRGNTGGVRASFYQSVPTALTKRYEAALTKLLIQQTQQDIQEILP